MIEVMLGAALSAIVQDSPLSAPTRSHHFSHRSSWSSWLCWLGVRVESRGGLVSGVNISAACGCRDRVG